MERHTHTHTHKARESEGGEREGERGDLCSDLRFLFWVTIYARFVDFFPDDMDLIDFISFSMIFGLCVVI